MPHATPLRALALSAALLAGCQTPPSTPPEPPATEAAAESTAASVAAMGPLLALDTEGLRVVDATSGSTTPLAYGMEMEAAVAAVTRLRGAVGDRSVNSECGAGPLDIAVWPGGLSILGDAGKFAGWALSEPAADAPAATPITTISGIGIGSTRADLDGVMAVTVEESTLGTEFSAGDLFGLLSGPGADATVTHLWSGVSCNFR